MKQPKPIIIDSKLNDLHLHLLWLGIHDYVFTTEFLNFCERIGLRGVWQMCYEEIEQYHRIPVSGPREQSDYAFKKFLGALFKLSRKDEFLARLIELLLEYQNWSGKELSLERIKKDLLALSYTEVDIDRAFGKLK